MRQRQQLRLSRLLLEIVASAWLCTEIGQFVEAHTQLGYNELFWPFWTCFSLVIVMGVRLLDIYLHRKT